MLCSNYPTFEMISLQSGGFSKCRLCLDPCESLEHLISHCSHFNDIRSRIKSEMISVCNDSDIQVNLNDFSDSQFTQFVLDPSSMNLAKRVNICDPALPKFFKLSRDFCFAIDRIRTENIKSKS